MATVDDLTNPDDVHTADNLVKPPEKPVSAAANPNSLGTFGSVLRTLAPGVMSASQTGGIPAGVGAVRAADAISGNPISGALNAGGSVTQQRLDDAGAAFSRGDYARGFGLGLSAPVAGAGAIILDANNRAANGLQNAWDVAAPAVVGVAKGFVGDTTTSKPALPQTTPAAPAETIDSVAKQFTGLPSAPKAAGSFPPNGVAISRDGTNANSDIYRKGNTFSDVPMFEGQKPMDLSGANVNVISADAMRNPVINGVQYSAPTQNVGGGLMAAPQAAGYDRTRDPMYQEQLDSLRQRMSVNSQSSIGDILAAKMAAYQYGQLTNQDYAKQKLAADQNMLPQKAALDAVVSQNKALQDMQLEQARTDRALQVAQVGNSGRIQAAQITAGNKAPTIKYQTMPDALGIQQSFVVYPDGHRVLAAEYDAADKAHAARANPQQGQ